MNFGHRDRYDKAMISESGEEGQGHDEKNMPYGFTSALLQWLHIVVSNAKAFILGTYYGLPKKSFQSYLYEYSFRFSRHDFDTAIAERLVIPIGTFARLC